MELEGWQRTSRLALGSWIAPRLTQAPGQVCGSVPDGFPAYARICHPVTDGSGTALTWSQVAEVTGGVAHASMQWHALIGAASPYAQTSARWRGPSPAVGRLEPPALLTVLDVLARHTRTADDCVCAYWVGSTRATVVALTAVQTGAVRQDDAELPSPPAVAPPSSTGTAGPGAQEDDVLQHPGREYELYTGALSAAAGPAGSRQSPHLLWPADRAWCLATDVDFDSTLVAGDAELVDELLAAPGLDAWRVSPSDSLTFDADRVNGQG